MIYVVSGAWSLTVLLTFLVLFVALIAAVENDSPGKGTLALVAWVLFLTLFTDFRPWTFVADYWLLIVLGIPAWLAIGVGYALIRWKMTIDDPSNYSTSVKKLDPSSYQYRNRIISWISWWLPSAVWLGLKYPRKIVAALYDRISGVFDRMAEGAKKP